MVRYYLTGTILKLFSCCSSSRQVYRFLGNTLGVSKRKKGRLPKYYVNRVKQMLEENERYGFFKDGTNVVELGTGWVHWEAVTARLFYDIKATLFDVWDNRQLSALQNYVGQLQGYLSDLEISKVQMKRAEELIGCIKKVKSFDELYNLLGFTYVIDPEGRMDGLGSGCFDVVTSAGVMEHIKVDTLPRLLKDIRRVLKPGGNSIHHINLMDHLRAYAKTVSCKQYLCYSEGHWRRFLHNEVQYINRLQRPEWLQLFEEAGLVLINEKCTREPIPTLTISENFRKMNSYDLSVTTMDLLHMKKAKIGTSGQL
ncbi:MAG: methyltransferase domain-containing protein [Chitinispirillaceae bacterium]